MTDEQVGEQTPAGNETQLRLATGPLAGPVLCRVVSMVLNRAEWPVDRLNDAMLVCDALCAHASDHSRNGRVVFGMDVNERRLEMRVEDLSPDGAEKLLRDAELPGVGNVIERIADGLSIELADQGMCSRLVLTLVRDSPR